LVLYRQVVPPGDSAVFSVSYPLGEVIADSLPAGRYHVLAVLNLSEKSYRLNAGTVSLAPAPDLLPNARMRNGLTYVARARVVRGRGHANDTVRTLVFVKNTSDQRRELDIADDCPVMIDAYRTPLRRDLREPNPVMWGSHKCTGVALYRFALEPGASWVFGQDVPAADFIKTAGPGRFWINAWVPGPSIQLAAGPVDIKK